MSELKEVKLSEMNAIKLGLRNDKLYFKSEADKVIADLNRKIKLYEDLGSCKKGCLALRHNQRRVESEIYRVKLKEKEILRHKYKRCLAMADFCESQYDYYNTLGNGFWLVRGDVKKRDEYRKKSSDFWWKWHKRWLKIAEQFKEMEK